MPGLWRVACISGGAPRDVCAFRRCTFISVSGPGALHRDDDGVSTGQEVSERPQPRPRGGKCGVALIGLDSLARLHSRLHGSGPARRGGSPAAAWTVADVLAVVGVAAGATWALKIDAEARSLYPARVRHRPADVVAFAEVAAAWPTKARAVLAERHRRQGARPAGGVGQFVAGDGVGWGAVDHLRDVDMVHMPTEMSMETAVPIDFQEAWAEAQRPVNKRVVAAVEADDPDMLDRALKWKYLLRPQYMYGRS
eukprot:jgi/Tetstr1/441304/TSEL_029555.t1